MPIRSSNRYNQCLSATNDFLFKRYCSGLVGRNIGISLLEIVIVLEWRNSLSVYTCNPGEDTLYFKFSLDYLCTPGLVCSFRVF
jgi:hypothetical protein